MRKYRFLATVFPVVLSCIACAQREGTLENINPFTQYHGVTFVERFKIWAAGPDDQIGRDAFYEPRNYIYDGKVVRLAALPGETESFQVVVNADYGNVNDVTVVASRLVGPGGAFIPPENVTVFLEFYVKARHPSGAFGRKGEFADALIPAVKPVDVAKAQAQPFFVTVAVPRDATPGIYRGELVARAKGARPERLTVELLVGATPLPADLIPDAAVEVDYATLAGWEAGSAKGYLPYKKVTPYLTLLKRERCIPLDGGYIPAVFNHGPKKAAKVWARGLKPTGRTYFYLSPETRGETPKFETLAEEYGRLLEASGSNAADNIVWLGFEGGSPSPFARPSPAAWWRDAARAAASWPGRPRLAAATSPFRGAPDVTLRDAVGVWVCDFADVAAFPEGYQNLGRGQIYFIRADGCGADVVDGRRAGMRLLSWYGYVWGAAGVVALAPPAAALRPRHPFADDPMAGTPARFGNGLGLWFYPGRPVGFDEPLPSVRLELLREGLEDWALFKLYEKKFGRELVTERLKAVLPYHIENLGDVTERALANNEIYELRRAFIEGLSAGKTPGRRLGLKGRVTDAAGTPLYHARVGDAMFATYTDAAGGFELTFAGSGYIEVTMPGYRSDRAASSVKLFRLLRGMEALLDFEQGVEPAQWLTGEPGDALAAADEREIVSEGRVALAVTFPCGRVSRVVNLYPRIKDLTKYHRLEFDVFNPNDFLCDLTLLLLDDDAAPVEKQFRRRLTLRPRSWTRVSLNLKRLPDEGESSLRLRSEGAYYLMPQYRPVLSHLIGVGFEADGLEKAGGRDNTGSYKLIVDNVKVIIFE